MARRKTRILISIFTSLLLANVVWFYLQWGNKHSDATTHEFDTTTMEAEKSIAVLEASTDHGHESSQPVVESYPETSSTEHGGSKVAQPAPRNTVRGASEPPLFTDALSEPLQPVEERVRFCFETGPFLNNNQAERLGKALASVGADVELETRIHRQEAGWWVFLPPARSLSLGRLKVEELKQKGLNDVVLVQKSEPKFAISLGVFKHRNVADERIREVLALGYQAQIEKRFTEDPQIWLKVSYLEDVVEKVDWAALIKGQPEVQYSSVECLK